MVVKVGAVVSATTFSAAVVEVLPDWCTARTATLWLPRARAVPAEVATVLPSTSSWNFLMSEDGVVADQRTVMAPLVWYVVPERPAPLSEVAFRPCTGPEAQVRMVGSWA
ncbi:hypothetical protein ALMP_19720 [Streptomyces sp. A012304]|nr:hypothetical protein ALMP_19720 [Streptomyces sp. A012304]